MANHVFFDLDGTLSDPFEGISSCICFALEKMGRPAPPQRELAWCIGPPLQGSFKTLLSSEDEEESWQAVLHYRERFSICGYKENTIYPGVREMLSDLANAGKKLYVASSKPHVYVQSILEHFEILESFVAVFGSELDGSRAHKEDLLSHALSTTGAEPTDCVMVGDRSFDVLAGNALGMHSIGVLYGYGSREELEAATPDALAESPSHVATLLTASNF